VTAFKHDKLEQRLTAASAAKQALLEKYRQRPGPDDPAVIARRNKRAALSAERDLRIAERDRQRAAEAARLASERETAALAEAAERMAAAEQAASTKAAEDEALKVEQKAARDARYAARKARR
jgi:hypothetical protein